MATKYSFHVKASKSGEQKPTSRADHSGNELNSDLYGERIVVPTKGCIKHSVMSISLYIKQLIL